MNSIVAVVLAGGQARRMGGLDKPLLPLGGRPLLRWVLDALAPLPAAINANGDPARFAAFGVPVIGDGYAPAMADRRNGQGPLSGIRAAMAWARDQGADAVLTVPGDTPFVPRDLGRALSPAPACAASLGRAHHAVALWPVAALDALTDLLNRPGSRRVADFAAAIGVRTVDFPTQPWDPFANVNTPGDLARLEAALPAGRPGDDA